MIRRDGDNKSLWQKTISRYKPVNHANRKEIYDAIIIGGGITGITTAKVLQENGLSCLVIEAYNLVLAPLAEVRLISILYWILLTQQSGKILALKMQNW
ncbi:MAG: NAD(P)-binding protein [Bacteroidota bacterium]